MRRVFSARQIEKAWCKPNSLSTTGLTSRPERPLKTDPWKSEAHSTAHMSEKTMAIISTVLDLGISGHLSIDGLSYSSVRRKQTETRQLRNIIVQDGMYGAYPKRFAPPWPHLK